MTQMMEVEALVEKIEEVDDKFAWDDHLLPCLLRQRVEVVVADVASSWAASS